MGNYLKASELPNNTDVTVTINDSQLQLALYHLIFLYQTLQWTLPINWVNLVIYLLYLIQMLCIDLRDHDTTT